MTSTALQKNKIAILGASRGLGRALAFEIAEKRKDSQLFLSSRKSKLLDQMQIELKGSCAKVVVCPADFTKKEQQDALIESLVSFSPETIFYVAGGGPFGTFSEKNWPDHQWAYELGLIFPARLLHVLLSQKAQFSMLQQIIFVGSAVAESKPDPNAASYASSKHGLKGLVETVRAEQPQIDIRLFSPGYMDTDLLPVNSWPRKQGVVASARSEAAKLWQWATTSID